ncbi:MAG: hypothetical protein PHD04_03100 [Candidatus Pacebacteria bacterium]|nr:hypothetical protein [Candidatus Paceibacterota bacterium]
MNNIVVRGMFRDVGCMITANPIAHDIELEVWAAKRRCTWLDAMPQSLEYKIRPSVGRLLQHLHPKVYEKVCKMGEREVLLAYWRAQARSKKQLPFLEFLCELNVNLRVDFILA